jgi:antitoxin component YwqK of YwqJK toxin-antitoxin module
MDRYIYKKEIPKHINNPATFLSYLLTIKHVDKNIIEVKKFELCKHVKAYNEEYYLLPNGKKHGLYQLFNTKDKPIIKATYYNGKMHGPCEERWVNGNLRHTCTYINEKKNGIARTYNLNGKLFNGVTYIDELMDGKCITYSHEDRCDRTTYVKGIREGPYSSKLVEYKQEKVIYYQEGYYSNDMKNGTVRNWVNGELVYECNYINDELNGTYKEWLDGKLIKEAMYINGRLI